MSARATTSWWAACRRLTSRSGGRAVWLCCGLACASLVSRVGLADEAIGQAPPADETRPYGGVTLDGGAPPTAKAPPEGLQYVTWPGFRADKELGAEVFLQLTGPVSYKSRVRGRRVEVTLDAVQVYLQNNLWPVLTSHFPGPVKRFQLRKLKGDKLRLDIELSRSRKPTITIEQKHPPYSYLVVHFPPK